MWVSPGLLTYLMLVFVREAQTAGAPSTLKFVSVLYRHGDRSPEYIYPTDMNQLEAWPDGLGWLSNIGKNQQHELGQYVRARYGGFLNTSYYHHEEIRVESSDIERCLMSAENHLAGLFPPQGPQVWHPDIPWQPIPVHTRPELEDNKLAIGAPCPRYDQLMEQELNSPAIKKEEEENKEFYDMVERESGVKKETVRDIWKIVDTLICERAHNLTWNDWVHQPGVWDKLNKLRTLSFDLLFFKPEMAKLKGGPLLKEIVANMEAAARKAVPLPKFLMYSAHDTTVAALLSAMHVFDSHQPMYRAMVMVELHEVDDQPVVKVFYKNTTDPTPVQLHPPGCENPCKLSTFTRLMSDTIPLDWNAECQLQSLNVAAILSVSPASWVALCVGVGLCAIVCVSLVVAVVRLRRQRDRTYVRI